MRKDQEAADLVGHPVEDLVEAAVGFLEDQAGVDLGVNPEEDFQGVQDDILVHQTVALAVVPISQLQD